MRSPAPSSAAHLAREEEPELEDAARRVQVLARGDARDRRLVHADRLGHVLAGSSAASTPRRCRGRPAGARRSCARRAASCRCGSRGSAAASAPPAAGCAAPRGPGAGEHAGIALVHADARQCRRVELDHPALRRAPRVDVRHDVLGARRLDRRARGAGGSCAPARARRRVPRRSRAARAAAPRARGRRPVRGGGGPGCGRWRVRASPGSSCASCSSMHSATERAPTPAGSNCCTMASTRPTPAASVRTSPATVSAIASSVSVRYPSSLIGVDDGAADGQRVRRQVGEFELPGAGGPAACAPIRRRARARHRRFPTRATRTPLALGSVHSSPISTTGSDSPPLSVVCVAGLPGRLRLRRPGGARCPLRPRACTFVSSASSTCACSSIVGSCSRRIACCSCGVIVSCWPIRSWRLGFIMRRRWPRLRPRGRRMPACQSLKSCPK